MRLILAPLVACLLAGNASANPLALILANREDAPEISDPAASSANEAAGEPAAAGELDAADLAKLGGRLASIALAYESFRDPTHLDAEVKSFVDYTSPHGLIPDSADRTQTLNRVYRALALVDDTRALRYPEGESCARAHRLALLRSPDGLFADPKTGELSPWLKAELKRSKANDAPSGLIAASAREWTELGYLKSLAEVQRESRLLADGKVLGASRAEAFCRRAKLYEDLASAQGTFKWSEPDLTEQSKAVVEVRWGKEKGAGTVLIVEGRHVVLVSGRLTENAYETPDLVTKSGKHLSASYVRRGPALSLLSIQSSPDVMPIAVPPESDKGERVAYAVGHPVQGGPWSVTRGLARPEGALIRADAAVDGAQAGGPLFDGRGRLIGIVAGEGAAYDLAAITAWLKDENASLPEVSAAGELGTGALLTASSAVVPKEKSALIEAGAVCKDYRGCTLPSAPSWSAPSRGFDFSATYTGPTLWSMLGKLLSPPPPKEQPIQDNRRNAQAAVAPVAPVVPVVSPAPKPPPDPLRPISLKLSVSRTTLAQGEELEAVATVGFTGKEGSKAGRGVSFTVTPGGKVNCPSAATDASGVARTTCTALENVQDRRFDALQDETRRRLGMKTAGRVRRKPVKGDKVAELKERFAAADEQLDAEAAKYPEVGSDTPGIDRPLPEAEIAEYEIKGDLVTLGASLERLKDVIKLDVLERPCFGGGHANPVKKGQSYSGVSSTYRCIQRGGDAYANGQPAEDRKDDSGDSTTPVDESKPDASPPDNGGKKKKGRQSDLPVIGEPNSSDSKDFGDGKGQIRDYDSEGRAKKDHDFGHDHGQGDPHVHDWDWTDPAKPARGPGRPLKPGE